MPSYGNRAKDAVRAALRKAGWEVFRARGGLFICPTPRAASHVTPLASLPGNRLHLGCGNVRLDGYLNIDVVSTPATDIVSDIVSLPMMASDSAEEIRLEAVLEHLFRHERIAALQEWARILRPGGKLVIRYVPDFDYIARAYVEKQPGVVGEIFDLDDVYRYTHGDPVPWNAPEQIHKDIFTRHSLEADLRKAAFEAIEITNVAYRGEGHRLNLDVTATKPGRDEENGRPGH